jgi:hypothetical protein
MWINPTTQQTFTTHSEIRAAFPNTSLPAILTDDFIESLGLDAVAPPPPPPPTVADFDAALTAHLDAVARSRRYDNRITCALRAGYAGPFQAEGQAFATWMDNCNMIAYTLLAEVQAGTRALPTSTQALLAEMPAMTWPT